MFAIIQARVLCARTHASSSPDITSKKSNKREGRPLCSQSSLGPNRKRGSDSVDCGGASCTVGSKTARGREKALESDMRMDICVPSDNA
jgi:hypothetical protein